MLDDRERSRGAGNPVGCRRSLARRPRPDAARPRRDRGLPGGFARRALRCPLLMLTARDDDLDKIVGSRGRRRRLPHEALQSARARGTGYGPILRRSSAGKNEARRRGCSVMASFVLDAGRRECPRRAGGGPAGAQGVRPPLGAPRPQGPRPHARPAARAGLGLHVCGRHPDRRRPRTPAAAEAR